MLGGTPGAGGPQSGTGPDEVVTVPEPGTGLPSILTWICELLLAGLAYLAASRSVTRACTLAVPPANALSLTAESNPDVIGAGTPGASQGGVGGPGGGGPGGGIFACTNRFVPAGRAWLGEVVQAASC